VPHDSLFKRRQLAHPDTRIISKYEVAALNKPYLANKRHNEGLTKENPFSDTFPTYELVVDNQPPPPLDTRSTLFAKRRLEQ
jgi:hypothetical protein